MTETPPTSDSDGRQDRISNSAACEAPGMVTIRQDDLEHLLDWHNKSCGDAEDAGMFERLLAVIPREADDAD